MSIHVQSVIYLCVSVPCSQFDARFLHGKKHRVFYLRHCWRINPEIPSEGKNSSSLVCFVLFLPEPPSRWLKYSCFVLLKSNVCWINDKYHSCRSNSYFDPLDVCRAKTSVVNMVLSWAIHLWNAAWAATLFFKSSQTPQKPPKNNVGSQCAKCKQQ